MFDFFNNEGKLKAQQRTTAVKLLNEELRECEGICDVGVVLGAAKMAEALGLITHNEYNVYHSEAYKRNKAYEEKRKAEAMQKAAERKAERAAKAKAAKI